tara:strand:+ start:128 stop:1099 length:972 start_codon:yes stop_codon:yes gene_type:complete
MNKFLFIFPGQGAQYKGIGNDIYNEYTIVRETYQEADDALDFSISNISFNDPKDQLNQTHYTQPALLTHSIACLRLFSEQIGHDCRPSITAGHSLGEYSSLVTANSMDFTTAINLVEKRGELMGLFGKGEMEALPIDRHKASDLALQHYCGVAACNLPEQTVVGGLADDLDMLVTKLQLDLPKKKTTRLKTEGAFHTYFMIEAANHFRPILESAEISPPTIDVISNLTGNAHSRDPEKIRAQLFLQLFNPVLWYESLDQAKQSNITNIIEFGGGIGGGDSAINKKPNLASIVKRYTRNFDNPPRYHSVINLRTLYATIEELAH